jgi:hypothetical protein
MLCLAFTANNRKFFFYGMGLGVSLCIAHRLCLCPTGCGINMRHLGELYQQLRLPVSRAVVACEMSVRVLKSHLRTLLRSLPPAEEAPMREAVARLFSDALDAGGRGAEFWRETLQPALDRKYNIHVCFSVPLFIHSCPCFELFCVEAALSCLLTARRVRWMLWLCATRLRRRCCSGRCSRRRASFSR